MSFNLFVLNKKNELYLIYDHNDHKWRIPIYNSYNDNKESYDDEIKDLKDRLQELCAFKTELVDSLIK